MCPWLYLLATGYANMCFYHTSILANRIYVLDLHQKRRCKNVVNLIYGTISVRRTGTNGQVFQDTKTTTTRHCIAIRQELQNELKAYKDLPI